MTKKLVALIASMLVIGWLAMACGGGGGGGGSQPQNDEEAIKKLVSDFGMAFNDGKASNVIAMLDAESRKGCDEKELQTLLTLVKTLSGGKKFSAEATNVKVTGNTATAQVVSAIGDQKQSPEENKLVKENGKWKLAFGSGDCGGA